MKKTLIALSLAASLVAGSAIAVPGAQSPLAAAQAKHQVKQVQSAVETLEAVGIPVLAFTATVTNGTVTVTAQANAEAFLANNYGLTATQAATPGLIVVIGTGATQDAHLVLSALETLLETL